MSYRTQDPIFEETTTWPPSSEPPTSPPAVNRTMNAMPAMTVNRTKATDVVTDLSNGNSSGTVGTTKRNSTQSMEVYVKREIKSISRPKQELPLVLDQVPLTPVLRR